MDISVIVPLYYGKKYIPKIICMINRTIVASAKQYSVEIILINDSPEEDISTKEISFTKSMSIKLYCNKQNLGIHRTRIRGLEHAEGKYILFLDQDDEISENYFETQLSHIGSSDVVVSNGTVQYNDYSKELYRWEIMHWTVKHLWFYAKFNSRIISPGQCLIKKSSIPQLWIKRTIKANGADDYYLWLLMLINKCSFAINRNRIYTHKYTASNASLDTESMQQSVSEMLNILGSRIPHRYLHMISRNNSQTRQSLLVKAIEKINRL